MKKKVLSDSDEVSGCALDVGVDRLERQGHSLLSCWMWKHCFQSL